MQHTFTYDNLKAGWYRMVQYCYDNLTNDALVVWKTDLYVSNPEYSFINQFMPYAENLFL
jgi:hypothetical protein